MIQKKPDWFIFVYTNWIIENKLLVGTYPREKDVDNLQKLDIFHFVSLVDEQDFKRFPELKSYHLNNDINYKNYPIPDRKTVSDEKCLQTAQYVKNLLDTNVKVYLHCRGGKGRAGTIAAVVLLLYGYDLKTTLELLKKSIQSRKISGRYPKMPQTRLQLNQVKRISLI